MRIYCQILCCASIVFSGVVYANDALNKELVQRITQSSKQLQTIEQKISRESTHYAEELERKQQEIKTLRKEAAALQRLADEQLLGLDQLASRVDQWKTQNNYQKHLMTSYVEGMGIPVNDLEQTEDGPKIDARILNIAFSRIESALSPAWNEQEVVSPEGAIVKTSVLQAGPVEVAFDKISNEGGLVVRDVASEPRVLNTFKRSELSELESLQTSGDGYLSFDPTLGNALQLRNQEDSIIGHLNKGGVWAIPIVFFGFLSLVIALLKSSQFFRLPKLDTTLADKLNNLVQEHHNSPNPGSTPELKQKLKQYASTTGVAQQKLLHIAFSTPVSSQRDDLLVAYLMEYKHNLERYMGIVGTSAAIAPLLGLLGTVSGMISTFKMMTIFGSGDASTVSGGISEALVTTELGLIVAIPSLVVSALLIRKAKSYAHSLETFTIKLSKIKFAA